MVKKDIFSKNFYNLLISFILISSTFFIIKNVVYAQFGVDQSLDPNFGSGLNESSNLGGNLSSLGQSIVTAAPKTEWQIIQDKISAAMNAIKDRALQEWKWAYDRGVAQAYKAALSNFLNNLAYDTATYLATGDKGQSPMFETDNLGAYLTKVGDGAAGSFLEELGKQGPVKFNFCRPDLKVLAKISLGLSSNVKPKAPACTFSELTKNWDTALKSKDFLPKFQDMFNPWSNDLGIALTLQTGMVATQQAEQNWKGLTYQMNQGIHAVTDPISGKIKTPPGAVSEQMKKTIAEANQNVYVYTGDAVADAIGVFVNTLTGKLMDKWLKKGLVTNFSGSGGLTDPNAQNSGEGISGAEDRFRSLVEPNFKVRGDYDILAELTSCPDPNKAGPTNCVIDEKFRQAIEKRLTVRQAIEQGYLNGNAVFGFNSGGLEPSFNEGYSYRTAIILRKFRIVPVGWEIAAQKTKDRQTIKFTGTKNLNDMAACFSPSDDFKGFNDDGSQAWCQDLVDPNWVLKAPQNFCKSEGAGPEILSEQVTGEGANSSLSILRNDTYCADEQSCIKEKNNGACELYGYCTEERRTWDFNSNSCEPRNNTCQTFRAPDGNTVSYLENTLDYGACNLSNAGCLAYCRDYSPAAGKFTCTGSQGNKINLNKQAETCDKENQGCHEFIRVNSGGGANLLPNSDFEEPLTSGGWSAFGAASSTAYQGAFSLKMNGSKFREIVVGTTGYNIAGESYALSFYAKNCAAGDRFLIEDKPLSLSAGGDWARYNLVYTYPFNIVTNKIKFTVNSSSCLIDNIKLEKGKAATGYSGYAAQGSPSLIYEKIAPSYLNCAAANPPAECQNFSRFCSVDEAGCELYTGVADGAKIPAKVAAQDYCPAECVGYNTYIQSPTVFDSARDAYFIPKTAKTCSAESVGCDQFTNLDEVAKGGEGVEYYTYLRQCLKKTAPPTGGEGNCVEFYNWEGSDESGYQLKVESLKKSGSGISAEPALSQNDAQECNQTIYNLPASDPAYNPDCRQFYNRAGGLSYHLYSRTIACSDDCHPYRLSNLNVDDAITSAAQCSGSDKHWDAAVGQCAVCKNGGAWSSDNNACVYQAIPNQGVTCSAAQNGCREYIGNTGNNVRKIFTDDFSGGTVGAWAGLNGSTVAPSSEALILDADNKGNSLKVSGGQFKAKRPVGSAVTSGKSYILSFLAKASAPVDLNLSLVNGGLGANFAPVRLTAGWQIFQTNLTSLNHEATSSEYLLLAANLASGGNYYIDNITLTEIVDRYYLIKNSWRTPDSCYNDISGVYQGDMYNLGCAQYVDRADKTNNLRQFNKLCSESAVGCELMIDTKNSANPEAEVFNATARNSLTGVWKRTANNVLNDWRLSQTGNVITGINLGNGATLSGSYDPATQQVQITSSINCVHSGTVNSGFSSMSGTVICNNDPATRQNWQATIDAENITVPADSYAYVVYDPAKLCNAGQKGCEYLGKPYKYETTTLYGEVYLKNNPDKYGQILCGADAVGCQTYAYDNGGADKGEKNFKDPGDMVCEWRQTAGQGQSQSWLKKKVKRCGAASVNLSGPWKKYNDSGVVTCDWQLSQTGNAITGQSTCGSNFTGIYNPATHRLAISADTGWAIEATVNNELNYLDGTQIQNNDEATRVNWHASKVSSSEGGVCLSDADCSGGGKCQTETGDSLCPVAYDKTLGFGGVGSRVSQPTGNWAGICPAAESGCAEYIDPLSKFNANLIFNGAFQTIASGPNDGWGAGLTQDVVLEPNTVYRLGRAASAGALTINDCKVNNVSVSSLFEIDGSNSLIGPKAGISVPAQTNIASGRIFYFSPAEKGEKGSCKITAGNTAGAVELKPAVIDYQLKQNLDSQSCNGIVNFNKNCVLFNERSRSGPGLKALNFDADDAIFSSASTNQAEKDSNVILKVTPDRTCDKWLACRSYVKDDKGNNVCFDVGLCDAVDANGNCQSFLASSKVNQIAGDLGTKMYNLTGYSKIGISPIGATDERTFKTDYYPMAAMKQAGEMAEVPNGGFEYYGSNGYPVGWTWSGQAAANEPWNANIFSVINNPVAAQAEAIGSAPEGKSFIKLGSSFEAESEYLDVIPNTDYIITAYVNTKNLKSGQATIDILGNTTGKQNISLAIGNDWQFRVGKFKTAAGESKVKVKLSAPGAAVVRRSNLTGIWKRTANNALNDWQLTQAGNVITGVNLGNGATLSGSYTPNTRRVQIISNTGCDHTGTVNSDFTGMSGSVTCNNNPATTQNWQATLNETVQNNLSGVWQKGSGSTANTWMLNQSGGTISGTSNSGGTIITGSLTGNAVHLVWDNGWIFNGTVNEETTAMSGVSFNLSLGESNVSWQASRQIQTGGVQATATAGNFYFDDIKIRPALESKCLAADGSCVTPPYDAWHTPQSCRLYPKSDSLSCDYYEDSGARQKGWYGYCLEYDRAPGDPNACLLWYPIDKVKGDGIEENKGYQGKLPVYYSLEAKTERFAEYRHAFYLGSGDLNSCSGRCPEDYQDYTAACHEQSGNDYVSCICAPKSEGAIIKDGGKTNFTMGGSNCVGDWRSPVLAEAASENDGWYPYNGIKTVSTYYIGKDNKFVKELCGNTTGCDKDSELFRTRLYMTKVAQTVSSVGQNKFWGSRVYKGTDYVVPDFGYVYGSDSSPFGSVVPPQPVNNPYEWDGDGVKNFNQPISYNTPDSGKPRLGQGYNCISTIADDCKYVADPSAQDFYPYVYLDLSNNASKNSLEAIKRIFAKSYGIWSWDGTESQGNYKQVSGLDWTPPDTVCGGNGRPAYPNDFCGIKPKIDNVKINGSASEITFTNNGFANLTFNTVVDADQLPMVMYAVDWGDGEKTTVSGVEMRDRPNPKIPHSLYHLYSYWDLKAKANSGVGGVNCSTLGQCSIQPKIKIKDNWGWCNDGTGGAICDQWVPFGGNIIVREK